MGIHLALESVLVGASLGRVVVGEHRAALAWTGHRVYLTGNVEGAGFEEALGDYVRSRRIVVVYPDHEALEGATRLFPGCKVTERKRRYYEIDPSAQEWAVNPPNGYAVERITAQLLEKRLLNTDRVEEEMCSEREIVGEFLEKSFAFAAIHGGGFAAWCMSEYNLGDRCEVGIETVAEHRRRGLAVLVAGAMFRHAASVGIRRVGWHCWADNAGSVATAETLGLRLVSEFPALVVDARGHTL
jgi:RimJ/RimL family protein N-acetyltransferase